MKHRVCGKRDPNTNVIPKPFFEISLQFFFWKLTIFENVILSESHKTEEIENIIFKTF